MGLSRFITPGLSLTAREYMGRGRIWFKGFNPDNLREQIILLGMGVAEEGGEVLGIVKKWFRSGKGFSGLDLTRLHEEMMDEMSYLLQLGEVTNIDWRLQEELMIAKNTARWGPAEHPELEAAMNQITTMEES